VNVIAHKANMDIQRQGNCTNRSSGKYRHKAPVTGNIKRIAAADNVTLAIKRFAESEETKGSGLNINEA